MSLAYGRPYCAIPGPSVIPDRVLGAMHRAAPNIYEGEMLETAARVMQNLKTVARTSHKAAIYVSNGHGAWEAALANTLGPGDTALVLATGRFALGWGEMAETLGISIEVMGFGNSSGVDPVRVAARLAEDKDRKIKAVMLVQTDTASSVRNDIATLGEAMATTGHPALYMVDCIASLACEPFEMDAWGVDVMVTGCQKGLMTPPGLGIVFFNDRAAAVRAGLERVSSYWDWIPRADPPMFYKYFCGTAPTHHLFGIDEALKMLLEEGMDAVWARHEVFAGAVWAAVDAWGAGGDLALNISNPAERSTAVTVIRTAAGDGARLRAWTEAQAGLTLGIALELQGPDAPAAGGSFRIGHMGHLNPPMILGALGTIDAGLKALSIPHGAGALDAAAQVIADPARANQAQFRAAGE